MSQAPSPSTAKPYGLKRVCQIWHVPRSTVYLHRRRDAIPVERRPLSRRRGPRGPCDDADLLVHIRKILTDSPFHGEGYRKVWARLRFGGIRTSKDRVRRLMQEDHLQAPHRLGKAHGPKAHDRSIIPDKPDEMWGTDLTTTVTVEEGQAAVFAVVDHCTGECLGLHAAQPATRFEALEPLRQAVRTSFGSFAEHVAAGLKLRHDHGSQYLSDHFQGELKFLGIASSPAFVREPQGNGCVERFFRTLKENLLWVRTFRTVEELRLALIEFRRTYNQQWILERLGYRTPAQARQDACRPQEKAA
jgi:putative transposase